MKDKLIALLEADPSSTEEQLLAKVASLKTQEDAAASHAKRQAQINDLVSKTNMAYEAAAQFVADREAAAQKLIAAKAGVAKPQSSAPAGPKPLLTPVELPKPAEKPAEQPKHKNFQSR